MLDFDKLVDSFLLEQDLDAEPTPQEATNSIETIKKQPWFTTLKNKHAALQFTKIDDVLENDIIQTSLRNYLTEIDIQRVIGGVRILDTLEQIFNTRKTGTNKVGYVNTPEFTESGAKIAATINSYTRADQWKIVDAEVKKQYDKAKGTLDKQASIALDTYNNLSIIEGVIQIVKRRTDILSRAMNLKSVTQPFANVITDIFKFPEQYLSGQKAISTDFSEMVDKLYASDLINIAVKAKDFYAAEIANLELSAQTTSETNTNAGEIARNAVGFESKTFCDIASDILHEYNALETTKQQINKAAKVTKRAINWATDPKYREKYNSLKKKIKQDTQNYLNFITNKPVQYKATTIDGEESGDVKTTAPNLYTIGKIKNIETPEAIALITALRGVAQYDRTKPGVGERMAGAQQALQGVASFAGAKLYT
jgi:hypothetical protein